MLSVAIVLAGYQTTTGIISSNYLSLVSQHRPGKTLLARMKRCIPPIGGRGNFALGKVIRRSFGFIPAGIIASVHDCSASLHRLHTKPPMHTHGDLFVFIAYTGTNRRNILISSQCASWTTWTTVHLALGQLAGHRVRRCDFFEFKSVGNERTGGYLVGQEERYPKLAPTLSPLNGFFTDNKFRLVL